MAKKSTKFTNVEVEGDIKVSGRIDGYVSVIGLNKAPTKTTKAEVGTMAIANGKIYFCVGVNASDYIWRQVAFKE